MKKKQLIQVLKLAHYYLPIRMYSGLSIGLFIIRLLYTGSMMYGFLIWNLFLAFIPFWAGIKMLEAINQGKNKLKIFLWVSIWLGFLPNAPYILTDLFHLSPPGDAPLWYDLVLILSFAITGWMLWLISINAVHNFLSRTFKTYWVYSILILLFLLSEMGVYMGRYGRWNSWDLMRNPYYSCN